MEKTSRNTVAILLILALVFAGIGAGLAINNYQATIEGQFTEVPTSTTVKDEVSGEVTINIVPLKKGDESG